MGIFSDVYHKRNRVALKELAKRSQGTASGNTQGVREELRQVFSRLEMQPGYPKPSEAEQAFGFAAWVMWFLRFMAVSQQERNEICEKVDRTAAGAALFMRVLMSNPEHSEALRRGIPGFDPKDANTPLNSVGARFALVVQHLCRLYVIRGG